MGATVATKADISDLKSQINSVRLEMKAELEQVRTEIIKLRTEIVKSANRVTFTILGILVPVVVANELIQHFWK